MTEEQVILVDENDRELGTEPKLAAHERGLLHRAVSVFLFDGRGNTLLQRRAAGKYHSAGLWANACCSHPRPGESAADAARRRLREEMGVDCELRPIHTFTYRADVGGGLVEHELDHVFAGRFDGEPAPNPAEVADWRWHDVAALERDVEANPERYARWLAAALRGLPESER